MKKFGIIIASLLVVCSVSGQQHVAFHSEFEASALTNNSANELELLLAIDPTITQDQFLSISEDLNAFIDKQKQVRSKSNNDVEFLEKLFFKTHRKQLGWYENYVTFSDLISDKKYDCLTGTALYGLILSELDITYEILEFDFHLFVLAEVDGTKVLLEATDPYDGFVSDQAEIANRIKASQSSTDVSNVNKTYISNSIELIELAGLQYYNMGVNLFNAGEHQDAYQAFRKAELLYPSERIKNVQQLAVSVR